MIEVYESNSLGRRSQIATAPTFAEAKALVVAMGVAFMEDDEDHADCADAYLNDGRIVSIQPVGFTL